MNLTVEASVFRRVEIRRGALPCQPSAFTASQSPALQLVLPHFAFAGMCSSHCQANRRRQVGRRAGFVGQDLSQVAVDPT